MKNTILLILLTVFVVGCTPILTPVEPTFSPTSTNTPTLTPTPTPTLTPTHTPTPIPLGGGGMLYMEIDQRLIPQEYNITEERTSWFSASSDGSNLKLLDKPIWSISPDGQRALTYDVNKNPGYWTYWTYSASMINLDGTGETPLDDSLTYEVYADALWLPNGDVALIASEKKGYGPNSRDSMYILNPDGELTKLEEPSKLMKHYAYFLLPSPDGRNIYWANSNSKERYVTNLDNMESKRILKKVVGFQDMHISPSGKYIVFLDNSYRTLNGCFIYNVADDTLTKIMPEDGSRGDHFCGFGNHWSPTEDKLFGITRNGYALLNVPDGKITTFPGGDADSCRIASWMPDGKHIFLSLCTTYDQYGMGEMNRPNINTRYQDFIQSIGARLMNISDGKVTKYPDGGFCEVIISPDSKWVLFYACKNQEKLIDSPSKMLNLDTKEMVPIFTEFVSKRTDAPPDQNNQYFWSVTWLP